MADQTEAEIVADLAQQAHRPVELKIGTRYGYRTGEGEFDQIDLTSELPPFKTGTVLVRDVASFASYYKAHADDDSEVFADIEAGTVTAVLDAHRGGDGGPRWQKHRLTLALKATPAWVTWTEHDNKAMSQQEFAEFLEDNRRDLDPAGPVDAASFLEIAQSFQAQTKVDFESGHRLSTGEIQLVYKETTTGTAGRVHKIEIPTEFTLAIAPFDDCANGKINARFRYRVSNQHGVVFMYVLDNPDRHAQDAVREIVAKVSEAIGELEIMRGTPAA